MEAWVVWLILAAALGVAELVTLTFALGLLAIAALVAGVSAAAGLTGGFQVVIFAAAAVAGIVGVRPLALRHVRQPPALRTGIAALVGKEALTLTEVTRNGGRARIGGEEWTARPYDPDLVIPAGTTVDVMAIEGATALVYPQESFRELP